MEDRFPNAPCDLCQTLAQLYTVPLRLIPPGSPPWQALCGDCFRQELETEPAMTIDGVGRVLESGEWWKLIYDGCGHETWFDRVACRLFEPAKVQQVVLSFYAE